MVSDFMYQIPDEALGRSNIVPLRDAAPLRE
jgi:hypothetical protein